MTDLKKNTRRRFWYVAVFVFLAIVFISYASLWRSLSFDFWRDDWGQLWSATYKPELLAHEWAAIRLHPGSALEQLWGAKVFGLNTFPWQIFGLALKVLDSIAVAFMVMSATRSKKIAILSGLFFAALLPGLESFVWVSAHTSALFIFFFCLGMYFWFDLDETGNTVLKFVSSLILLSVSIFIDPGRGISILFLVPLWGSSSAIRYQSWEITRRIIFRSAILLIPLLFFLNKFNTGMVSVDSFRQKIQVLTLRPEVMKSFFDSLGNLLVGWIKPFSETGSLANITQASYYTGLAFVFLSLFVFMLFLIKRSRFSQVFLFFTAWIVIFYLPNWFFDQTLVLGSSHRYLTISAVGLSSLAALLVGNLKKRYTFVLAALFIIINIRSSNIVLASQEQYRSRSIVESLWNKIDSDVPKGEMDSIFMYGGGDYLRGVALDWSASVPFGIRRGITNEDDFPIVTGDEKLIIDLLCEENVYRPSLGKWSVQKGRILLSHLHAWELNNGVLKNVSEQKKLELSRKLICKPLL